MDALQVETIIGLATIILAPLLTWVFGGRRRVKVDAFTAFTTAQAAQIALQNTQITRQDALIEGLRDDLNAIAEKLQAKDDALKAEREAHAVTRAALSRTQDIVRRYFQLVRDAWAKGERMPQPDRGDLDWLGQPTHDEPPVPPAPTP